MPASAPPLPGDSARFASVPAPPRVRQLLTSLYGLVRQSLSGPLTLTVVELERELLKQAEMARNSQVQADLLAQARQLHPFADRFGERYLEQFAQVLVRLVDGSVTVPVEPVEPAAPAIPTLTLVADTDIDRGIVLAEIIRRESLRSSNSLQLLGQRLAVLGARPALELEQNPLGPVQLCAILRRIGEQAELDLAAQLALFSSFQRQVLERTGELIERANVLLDHEGVLPGLVYTPLSGALSQHPADHYPARQDAACAPRRIITGDAVERGAPASWSAMMQEALAPAAPAPVSAPVAATAAPAQAVPPPLPALDLAAPAMSALHQLLAQARQGHGAGERVSQRPAPEAPAAPGARSTQLQAASTAPAPQAVASARVDAILAQLQARIAQGAAPRSIADVQDAVLAQLRAEQGAQAALTVKDSDTLDLLGLLFQQIQQQMRTQTPEHDLVGRLQVPLARAALADPGFFVRDQHPARELLNAVAEAGAAWLEADDLDPQLVQKLGRTVDTVVANFNDDPQVFATAHEEVQQHFRAAAHKAELAERRHVEAARGRERLEVARQEVAAQIELSCSQVQPPRFVQTLLRQAWADVLTLTQLRHGNESAQWQQRLAETQRIAEVTALPPGQGHDADTALADEVNAALLQIGYHADEAQAISRRLSTPGGEDDGSSRTELTARLKARARLGEQTDAPDPRRLAPLARSAVEEDCYRQLRSLPFGSWFEFTTNQQGDVHRQRLSWYSLVTEHALFVNARGQKVAEYTLDTLARLMAQGQTRLVTEDKGRLIDRAWQAALRTLRTLAGDDEGAGA